MEPFMCLFGQRMGWLFMSLPLELMSRLVALSLTLAEPFSTLLGGWFQAG
jgi:hypothetical protein